MKNLNPKYYIWHKTQDWSMISLSKNSIWNVVGSSDERHDLIMRYELSKEFFDNNQRKLQVVVDLLHELVSDLKVL